MTLREKAMSLACYRADRRRMKAYICSRILNEEDADVLLADGDDGELRVFLIVRHQEDGRLKWYGDGRVRVLVGKAVIGDPAVPQTRTARRKRLSGAAGGRRVDGAGPPGRPGRSLCRRSLLTRPQELLPQPGEGGEKLLVGRLDVAPFGDRARAVG